MWIFQVISLVVACLLVASRPGEGSHFGRGSGQSGGLNYYVHLSAPEIILYVGRLQSYSYNIIIFFRRPLVYTVVRVEFWFLVARFWRWFSWFVEVIIHCIVEAGCLRRWSLLSSFVVSLLASKGFRDDLMADASLQNLQCIITCCVTLSMCNDSRVGCIYACIKWYSVTF